MNRKEPIVAIYVTDFERRTIMGCLIEKRKELMNDGKSYGHLENVIHKSAIAEVIKRKPREYEER